ncbi:MULTISPECIES: hypothetical protein [unclassified Caballeronia]|uniref:hypothetical protein n=1 Tax=unclassified Caballeronia TaxID=2646786 RepID=UPI0028668D6D|nr:MULTISPECIES: hypothetical protein [unclassified Caballeronia]MDR5741446.1 hypothetical protein [Caballeronia sp. LZ016]MDR5806759.1 hypothetical protein [Caballeronia sp. LZ019]
MSDAPYPFPKSRPKERTTQRTAQSTSRSKPASIARGLGWFSLALGAAQLLAPNAVARAAGVRTNSALMRLYGLREIACGVGILMSRNPAPYLWARVGGDVLDLATLAAASDMRRDDSRTHALGAIVNVAGIAALDVHTALSLSNADDEESHVRTQRYVSMYRNRSGFPRAPDAMRGEALRTFETPRDMRAPDALLPYTHPQFKEAQGA